MRIVSAALVPIAAVVLSAASLGAAASEGGASNYAVGAQTIAAALLPPPGATQFYAYVANVHSGRFRGGDGQSSIPRFDAEVTASAPRVMHGWATVHGVDLSSGAFAELVCAKVKADGRSDQSAGLDLLGLEPISLTTTVGDWHFLIGTVLYIPMDAYHPNDLANSTTHDGSAALQSAVTWTPTPRWDVSLNPDILVNLRNKATGYRSGSIFGLTGGASRRPFAENLRWQVGVNGYYEEQVTDDHLQGQKVPGGFRLRKHALGPQFAFWQNPGTVWLVKWQHEFDVRNGQQGVLVWAVVSLPL
jgi:hypothetical protein